MGRFNQRQHGQSGSFPVQFSLVGRGHLNKSAVLFLKRSEPGRRIALTGGPLLKTGPGTGDPPVHARFPPSDLDSGGRKLDYSPDFSPDELRASAVKSPSCMRRCFLLTLTLGIAVPGNCPGQTTTGYTFRAQGAAVGQQIWQHVTVVANTVTTYEQASQTISQRHRNVTSEQIRRLLVLEADVTATRRARVTYEKAKHTILERGHQPEFRTQPVSDKTYVVSRPNQDLSVTYEDGSSPPAEEIEIVETNLQGFGRPNPLAQFLDSRTLQVGETVELPRDLANELVGWNSEYGIVQRVTLRLAKVTDFAGAKCAVFDARIQGTPTSDQREPTSMEGQMTVEVATCRALSTNMTARLDIAEERGPAGHRFNVSNRGTANVFSQARYLGPAGRQVSAR